MSGDKINTGGMLEGEDGIPVVEEPLAPIVDADETSAEPEPEPAAETPAAETSEEPSSEPGPVDTTEALAEELGIIKQFGSVENALRQIPVMNRYTTQLQQERASWLRSREQEPRKEEPPDIGPDEFYADPAGSLRKLGIPTQAEVQQMVTQQASQLLDEQKAEDFIASKEDINQRWPRMDAMFAQMPELSRLPRSRALEILYRLTDPPPPKVVVEPSPGANKKPRATTAGGRPGGKSGGTTQKVKPGMSLEEMEKALGFDDD